jgi:hypothetical protein
MSGTDYRRAADLKRKRKQLDREGRGVVMVARSEVTQDMIEYLIAEKDLARSDVEDAEKVGAAMVKALLRAFDFTRECCPQPEAS